MKNFEVFGAMSRRLGGGMPNTSTTFIIWSCWEVGVWWARFVGIDLWLEFIGGVVWWFVLVYFCGWSFFGLVC